jgi:hypothetical protein
MNELRKNRPLMIGITAVIVFLLWLAFRPELLFVNKHVDDPFPATPAVTSPNAPHAAISP